MPEFDLSWFLLGLFLFAFFVFSVLVAFWAGVRK